MKTTPIVKDIKGGKITTTPSQKEKKEKPRKQNHYIETNAMIQLV
jgi:aromatic ring hydroxylase